MRALLIFFLTLGLFTGAQAADAVTGRVLKVLPLLLDAQGREAKSPSLFDRDAYQVYLRANPKEISGLRFDVQWQATKAAPGKWQLQVELRSVGEGGVPQMKTLEAEVTPGTFSRWTEFPLTGEDYKKFGSVVAWRATLWHDGSQLGERKSFLW